MLICAGMASEICSRAALPNQSPSRPQGAPMRRENLSPSSPALPAGGAPCIIAVSIAQRVPPLAGGPPPAGPGAPPSAAALRTIPLCFAKVHFVTKVRQWASQRAQRRPSQPVQRSDRRTTAAS